MGQVSCRRLRLAGDGVGTMQRELVANLPTEHGNFQIEVFRDAEKGEPFYALTLGAEHFQTAERTLVRIHSQCLTGDALGSLRCDCGWQLRQSMRRIGEAGWGVLIYLLQEGRGIGLEAKLQAYKVQDLLGLDTVEANLHLGYPADARTYEAAANVLRFLGISRVMLLTNNPAKIAALQLAGFDVERCALEVTPNQHNQRYLMTKAQKFGHILPHLAPDEVPQPVAAEQNVNLNREQHGV